MFTKKKIGMMLGTLMVAASMVLTGCGGSQGAGSGSGSGAGTELSGKVSASGSTALLPLLKPAQEAFQDAHEKVTVNVAGGGSFTGMNQVAEGSVDIGNSDVNLPDEYKDKGLVDHKVVVEPFVFIVDKANKVDNLTKQQVIDILTGKITNWSQVGGADQKITLIHRAKSSGSRATISDVVLKGAAFTDDAVIQDSNGAVRAAIASTPGAIGYVDAPYADDSVKVLKFDGVEFSAQNIIDGKYPIYGYGHMYTKGEPTGAVKAFIDFVMSDEFQNAQVEKLGFIPVSKMKK
ncbi:MAG TPA: phosphate-binding protein [Selenomonas sp.]|nr:phosphate ABC transporter substrate-binding protein [Selenomonadaceae bacterium]MDD6119868.1 phosphate ABC transporter substrate-binding protein [Selenomonadaceae bacterium]MDD7056472.1 phosphate ABC transporter substrate-binding protein [Selenomonadaceae bacterium]MDY3916584.1 phosphate ABC transporter substrate-binding protein [Selenomonadaceae bacterium]HBT78963.1 phosphate-binding protein [Selenomonas sp.]